MSGPLNPSKIGGGGKLTKKSALPRRLGQEVASDGAQSLTMGHCGHNIILIL